MVAKALLRLDGADGINKGLVGFWPLSQGAGRVAEDISPNKRHGTLTNVTDGWATSKFGRTLKLDGTDDYVSIPHSAIYDVTATNALTVSIWAAPVAVSAASYHGVMTKGREIGDTSKMWGIWLTETGYWHVRAGNNTINSASPAALGVWTHICVTINGSGSFIVYLNGVSIGSAGVTLTGVTSNVVIGTAGGIPEYFDGRLAGARIHNRVLRPIEVARLYRDPWAGTSRTLRRAYSTTGNTYNDTISDSGTASDTVTAAATYRPTVSDSGTGTDALTVGLVIGSSVSDTAPGTDALASTQVANVTVDDTATGTDALATTATQSVDLTDTGTPTDSVDGDTSGGTDTHDGFVRRSRRQRALEAAERRRRDELAAEAVALRLSLEAAMGEAAEAAEESPEPVAEVVEKAAKQAARYVPRLVSAPAPEVMQAANEAIVALRTAIAAADRARMLAEDDEEVMMILEAFG